MTACGSAAKDTCNRYSFLIYIYIRPLIAFRYSAWGLREMAVRGGAVDKAHFSQHQVRSLHKGFMVCLKKGDL